jgi:flagellar basal body rod protein FlgG
VDVISEMVRMTMVQRVFDTVTKAVASYEGMLTSLDKMKQ